MSRNRIIFAILTVALAVALCVGAAPMSREKTVQYWAYTYGDGVPAYQLQNGCSCVISPCAPTWELVGERTFHCDGSVDEWGYVAHPCASTTVQFGAECPRSTE